MAIVNLQRRSRELGRIRIGQVVRDNKGRAHPEKLDRFRITSASRPLLNKIAALYGGDVRPWTPQGGGVEQWEVITEADRLPILVPPQPISQYYELWSGGGCVRRCDGQTELLSGGQCVCGVDPTDRECKPTTRLNVVLRDVEGIGVFRLETKGWYSGTELPEVAEFLAQAGGYVAAHLGLEERVVKREGKTRRFMVPTIEVDVTPAQLLSGAVPAAQLGSGAATPALPVGPSAADYGYPPDVMPEGPSAPIDVASVRLAIEAASDVGTLRQMWPLVQEAGLTDLAARAGIAKAKTVAELREMWPLAVEAGLTDLAKQRAADIEQAEQLKAARTSGDPGELWASIMAAVPAEWSTDAVEADFERVTRVDAGEAKVEHMEKYLTHLASVKE